MYNVWCANYAFGVGATLRKAEILAAIYNVWCVSHRPLSARMVTHCIIDSKTE
jgi:hypothetical protein